MENPRQPRRQTILLLALLLAVTTVTVIVLQKSTPSPVSSDGIPLPFGGGNSTLQGSIKTIGSKGVYPVTDVSFDNGETSEVLPANTINFVLTPDSPTISHGAPLSVALTSGKRIFGYKYTSRDAALERARHTDGQTHTFAELFPGRFFVSDGQRSFDTLISQFETDHRVQFLPLSGVTLDRNARTIVIANDAATSVTTRGLLWCGDRIKNGTEQCDDGNSANGDGCSNLCTIESGYVCTGSPSACTTVCGDRICAGNEQFSDVQCPSGSGVCTNPLYCPADCAVCGNLIIEGSETCDDGNKNPGDGCSTVCTVESGYTCTGQPSQCRLSTICGNGVRETGEECDDGNNISNDSCDNTCHLVSTPF